MAHKKGENEIDEKRSRVKQENLFAMEETWSRGKGGDMSVGLEEDHKPNLAENTEEAGMKHAKVHEGSMVISQHENQPDVELRGSAPRVELVGKICGRNR